MSKILLTEWLRELKAANVTRLTLESRSEEQIYTIIPKDADAAPLLADVFLKAAHDDCIRHKAVSKQQLYFVLAYCEGRKEYYRRFAFISRVEE